MKQRFNSFSELSRHKKEGEDYRITITENRQSHISIVAPHGGSIEINTEKLAQKIAANDHNLYTFEALPPENSFFELHVESHKFDDPRCAGLVAKTDVTITIHGCRDEEPVIYLGGRDKKLKSSLSEAFNRAGIKTLSDRHRFAGTHPQNICNRNNRGEGVQMEFSRGIRDNPELMDKCVKIIRAQLKKQK